MLPLTPNLGRVWTMGVAEWSRRDRELNQQRERMMIMGAPKGARFAASFDEWFPQGLYLVGEIAPVNEYQSQEDKARKIGRAHV